MSEPPSGAPPKSSSRPPPGAAEVAPPTAVHHLAVKVRDLDRAEAFYVGVLGLTLTRRHLDERGRPRAFWLAIGSGFLAVERAERAEPTRADDTPGWHCIALAIPIEAREAWRARLAEKGFPVEHETAYTLYVRDPEGAVVALSHHPLSITGVRDESADPAATPAGVTARLAALVSLSAVLLALGAGGSVASAQRRPPPASPDDVLLVGSSSVDGAFGRLIESELEHTGMHVGRVGHPATGLARPDYFDWNAEIERLGDLHALRGVLVLLGGNDTQPLRLTDDEARAEGHHAIRWADEQRWRALYAARVTRFVDGLCTAGATRVLVVLPTDGAIESWSDRVHRVQEAQIDGTRASRCGAIVDPRAVSTRDERSTVDGVHLSRRGSRAVWELIAPIVQRALAG